MAALLAVTPSMDGEPIVADQTFGARLKQLREQAGLSQQDLADRTGMNRFGVSKLERDKYVPSWVIVQKIARALGTNCLAFEGTTVVGQEGDAGEPEEPPAKPARGRPKKQPPASEGEDPPRRGRRG